METKNYWVYILLCSNGQYYTGYTVNLSRRYQSHLDGTGQCKYTRSFKPTEISQCWLVPEDRALAMKVERFIKKLSRNNKEKLIDNPSLLQNNFPTLVLQSSSDYKNNQKSFTMTDFE